MANNDPIKSDPPADTIKESDKPVIPTTPTKPEAIQGKAPTTLKPTITPISKDEPDPSKESIEREVAFLKFPEVRRLTRIEYLNKVRDILNQHSSDSNSAKKAYAEIESITPE